MTKKDELMEIVDRATTAVAEIGILRDEIKKAGNYTIAAQHDMEQQMAVRKEIALNEYWNFVLEIANIRWEDLDLE